ncbi:MAG: hypothetical protein ACE5GH_05500, partial [Fidelibacterota bacterium]
DPGFVNSCVLTIIRVILYHLPGVDNRKVIRIKQLFMGDGTGGILNNMNGKNSHSQTEPKLLGQVKRVMGTRNGSPRTIQELLGHKSVKTTMIYIHVMNRGGMGVRSPLD